MALQFDEIAKVEMQHEARYRKLLENVKNDTVFKKGKKVSWHCRNCGYVLQGQQAPQKCPACEHPQAFFQVKVDNY